MAEGLSLSAVGRSRLERRPIDPGDVVVVACVRNEGLRLPAFLDHYRRLGVTRFLIVDNQSGDGSSELLDAQEDVVRWSARGSYAQSACGVSWTNAVTLAHARHCWVITVDADELLVYPDFERRKLQELVAVLETAGANAMRAPLLDMYPEGAVDEARYAPGEDLLTAFPLFDGDGYDWVEREGSSFMIRGGPRKRLFWDPFERDHPAPLLMKIPLYRWSSAAPYTLSTHRAEDAFFASISGLLLHFKFAHDFGIRAEEEALREEHFAGARQYRAYRDGFARDQRLSAEYPGSRRWTNSLGLLSEGMMIDGVGFAQVSDRPPAAKPEETE